MCLKALGNCFSFSTTEGVTFLKMQPCFHQFMYDAESHLTVLSRSEIRFCAVSWYSLRDQDGGCDHREVVLSLTYRLVRGLFGLLTVLVRSDLSKDVELLLVIRHENQVLRRQLGGRPRWGHVDRLWLAALSRLICRRRWAGVFRVTPAIVTW
jgi:putative transposase